VSVFVRESPPFSVLTGAQLAHEQAPESRASRSTSGGPGPVASLRGESGVLLPRPGVGVPQCRRTCRLWGGSPPSDRRESRLGGSGLEGRRGGLSLASMKPGWQRPCLLSATREPVASWCQKIHQPCGG
jgi:hypothetical protein